MSHLKTMRIWLHGAAAAAVGGAGTAVTASFVAPQAVNLSHAGLVSMGKIAAAGAVLALAAYMKQSPLPKPTDEQQK